MIALGQECREGRESPSPPTEFVDVTRADRTAPYAVSAWYGRFVRCRVLLDHKAGGLWDGCARKLLACRASRSFIRPLASLGPAAYAGIASTHHLTAVASACEAKTGFGILAGTRSLLGGGVLDTGDLGLNFGSPGSFVVSSTALNSVVGQDNTTRRLWYHWNIAGQAGNLTRQLRKGK